MAAPVPYWYLIAVLRSTLPLEEALAMRLYHAAVDLERTQTRVVKLAGDLAMGTITRLDKTMALGSIAGPGFEATIDTPRGGGVVRFVVTQEGLRHGGVERDDASELGFSTARGPRAMA